MGVGVCVCGWVDVCARAHVCVKKETSPEALYINFAPSWPARLADKEIDDD